MGKVTERLSKVINYKCDKCDDTGYIELPVSKNNPYGNMVTKCDCIIIKKTRKNLLLSPLLDVFEQLSFDNFETPSNVHLKIKERVLQFVEETKQGKKDYNGKSKWLLLSGKPGKGKTHLCTAAYLELLLMGKDGEYVKYAEEIPALERDLSNFKEDIKERAQDKMNRLSTVEVLYIDDLFKVTKGMDTIWSIIDSRYTNKQCITIISSEFDEQQMFAMANSDSLPSRIYERCGKSEYFIKISEAVKNWRL